MSSRLGFVYHATTPAKSSRMISNNVFERTLKSDKCFSSNRQRYRPASKVKKLIFLLLFKKIYKNNYLNMIYKIDLFLSARGFIARPTFIGDFVIIH